MHKSITIALAVCCAVLAGVSLQLWRENNQLRMMTQCLVEAVAEQKQQQEAATSEARGLAAEVTSLKERAAAREAAEAAQAAAKVAAKAAEPTTAAKPETATAAKDTPPGDKAPDFLGHFAKMMEKPEMREAMQAQQKVVLSMLYGNLFKKLNLTPEELDQFKDILVDRQMAGMTMLQAGDKQDRMTAMLEAQQQSESAVKELLGEEQYKVYKDYEATVGERMQLSQLNQLLAEKAMPLDEAQQEELITLMVEERQKSNVASMKEQQAEWLNGMPSDEMLNQQLLKQEELNKRVYERSAATLSVPQQAELKAFQAQQIQMQKLGIQMMKGFMSEKKEPAQ
ncbi:MAG: hypothetical protein A3K19_28470 [Lentisphaerae bacterium RIFOXYB12_FULL_65_16]|nr:MAG: hypothetical protein A3K18_19720 [Lentisphaerae bacterium RIFOXYA12_64_32]OGV85521.1 MAG: hypothetical protein A3K19_28470 [Lentisphaerae bacterium RIFOXYB12_FULL_65_16]